MELTESQERHALEAIGAEEPREPVKCVRGGRPRSVNADPSTLAILHGLGKVQCTWREVAAVLRIDQSTLTRFFQAFPEAREVYEDGLAVGCRSLRRTQFRLAQSSATMAIFLGKQYLGQTDKSEVEHTGGIDHAFVGQRVRDKMLSLAPPDREGGDSPEGVDP